VVAAILNDCYYLAKEFPKIEFEHNFREANMIAHELASVTRRVNQRVNNTRDTQTCLLRAFSYTNL
jgi:hypothetical protein